MSEKPFLNILDEADYQMNDDGPFKERYFPVSDKIGAQKLGYNVVILEPGFKVCPFHNHHINEEMFYILSGEGTLRFGSEEYAIKTGDIIACPPGGSDVAHQIINTGEEPLKYLCVSTNEPMDVCEYPDSEKLLTVVGRQQSRSFRHISRLTDPVDYYEGES